MSRPVESSIRSRQTGHVGSSMREGVGGGNGLRKEAVTVDAVAAGVKGSCVSSGNDVLLWWGEVGVWKVIDLMKATWQVSGCNSSAC